MLRTSFFFLFFIIAAIAGCCVSDPASRIASGLQAEAPPNPIFIANADSEYVWARVLDATDDYFEILREEPIRIYGNVLTEGRIDTKPLMASTYLEPWHKDSVLSRDRWESTFQTIQRKAVVRIIPENGGFAVSVAVYKELEDLQRPIRSVSGAANFYNESTVKPNYELHNDVPATQGWISMGRDTALEQRLLLHILHNMEHPPVEIPR